MLGRLRTVQESLLQVTQAAGESERQWTWAAAAQARLLCEEGRLIELLAALDGIRRRRRPKQDLRQEPAWLDPELVGGAEEPPEGNG